MTRLSKALCALTVCLLVLGALPAEARTTAVRFYDSAGVQITKAELAVTNEAGEVRYYAPTRGGIYYVDLDAREKVEFAIAGGRTSVGTSNGIATRMAATLNVTIHNETPVVDKAGTLNDECDDAIDAQPDSNNTGETITATPTGLGILPDADFCGTSYSNSNDVWYSVVGTGNEFTATTCTAPDTDYDSKLTVYCDSCDSLQCVDGNDDQFGGFDPACETTGNGFNRGSTVTWCTTPGAEYRIQIHGFVLNTGNFQMNVTEGGACMSDDGCPVRDGACCTDGPGTESECIITTQSDCEANDGLFLGAGADCVSPEECTALVVTFDSMTAVKTTDGVQVNWVTATEVDTVGFRVLREMADGREKRRVAASPLIHAVGAGLNGAPYQWVDRAPEAQRATAYYLEEVDLYGRTEVFGPIEIQSGARVRPTTRSAGR